MAWSLKTWSRDEPGSRDVVEMSWADHKTLWGLDAGCCFL